MHCEEVRALLDAYVDQELDVIHDLAIAAHLQTCQQCVQHYETLLALQAALHTKGTYFTPKPQLHRQLRDSLRRATRPASRRITYAACAAIGVLILVSGSIIWWQQASVSAPDMGVRDAIGNHVRSLMVDHLTDIASLDPHVLKPWFSTKLTFAPPVINLATHDYQLVGARLDYLAEQPVAAVIYQRRQHIINVFMAPASATMVATGDPHLTVRHGYHLWHWVHEGMAFWVVSDLNQPELHAFVRLIQAGRKDATSPSPSYRHP
jgi:anti-sigma factor RsiW